MLQIFIKALQCLSIRNKISFCILIFSKFISSFIEILTFALAIPLLTKVLEFDGTFSFENSFYLSYIKSLSISQILLLLFLSIFAKNFLLVVANYISFVLDKNIFIDLTNKLTNAHIQEFSEGKNLRPMPTIVRNITVELKHFQHLVSALFLIVQNFIYSVVIFFFLIKILDKNLFFFLIIAVLILMLYYFFTKHLVNKFGLKRLEYNREFYKNIIETFSLIKECFAFNKLDIFKNKLLSNLDISKSMDVNNKLISSVIKPLFEILIIAALIIYLSFFQSESSNKEILIVLTITLGVIFRLAPTIIDIATQTNVVNYNKSSLNTLYIYLRGNKKKKYLKSAKKKVSTLKFNNINFYFNKKKIIRNFSLNITSKNKIILSGKSGVGKSTLIDIVMGFKKQTSGDILLNNKIHKDNISNYFSYVPQRPYILNSSLVNNITLFQEKVDKTKLNKVISLCDLMSLDKRYLNNQHELGDNGSKISEGQKQKIGICRALYHNKEIYIFDEPTSNLDGKSEEKVVKNILKYLNKKIVIFITHNKKNYKFFDKIVNLD
jgi:ABC-type bacteriocin/lantibiotic exporter with double-glycine peptidase domain